jgi:hypothetical protein
LETRHQHPLINPNAATTTAAAIGSVWHDKRMICCGDAFSLIQKTRYRLNRKKKKVVGDPEVNREWRSERK